jgi:hypothetical protein
MRALHDVGIDVDAADPQCNRSKKPPARPDASASITDENKKARRSMKWNPGWFSAPHNDATDRIFMVMALMAPRLKRASRRV